MVAIGATRQNFEAVTLNISTICLLPSYLAIGVTVRGYHHPILMSTSFPKILAFKKHTKKAANDYEMLLV